ncbi:MAG: hypothetical protein COA47_10375 [Robiginitomaculum sp.]|nr:MAG: hypothetical protein COA47_10375 [Robiginitomaculum sp.]
MATEKNKVETPSSAYMVMQPRLMLGKTLLGGTPAMRDAEKAYLPQYERESKTNYETRLEKAVLFNAYKKTLNGSVGRVFSKPITPSDDMPPVIRTMLDDVDRQGNNLDTWARNSFRDGMNSALTHCLISFPTIAAETAEDQLNQKATPYFTMIPHENLIAAYSEIIDGVEVLTHIRIYEESTAVVDFEEVTVQRIKVVEPGRFDIYEKSKRGYELVPELSGEFDLDFIPLRTFYAERDEFMIGTPPLSDLGYLNVSHWQVSSDMQNTLAVASFPILAATGISTGKDGKIVIGPKEVLTSSKTDAKFYYVEHSGASIKSNRDLLQDTEGRMALEGLNLLRQRKSGETATGRALDSAEETSDLREMALRYQDFLNSCIEVAAVWAGQETPGTVEVNTDNLVMAESDIDHLRLLYDMAIANRLSWVSYYSEVKRRSLLADAVTYENELKLIEKQPVDDRFNMFGDEPTTKPPSGDSE